MYQNRIFIIVLQPTLKHTSRYSNAFFRHFVITLFSKMYLACPWIYFNRLLLSNSTEHTFLFSCLTLYSN